MAKLFPFRGEETRSSAEPRLVDIDDAAAEEVFAALSSDTARAILSRLYETPDTASGVAESADTSIQNARYHLGKLEAAGLVEQVDTWYSSRGTEMTVYAPTNEPLVVAAGNEESKGVLRRALERVVGAVAVLALASVVIDRLAGRSGGPFGLIGGPPAADPGDTGATPAATDAPNDPGAATGAGTDAPAATGAGTDAPAATGTPAPDPMTSTDASVATNPPVSPTDKSVRDGATPPRESIPAEGTEPLEASPTSTASPSSTPTPTDTPAPTDAVTDAPTPTETVMDATPTTVDGAVDAALSVPPGALFFAGGLAVIAAGTAWWYLRRYRPMYAA